jgi:hypothetical protein
MTRDDIIRMAREAGFYDGEIGRAEDAFERFAALVAEEVRGQTIESEQRGWLHAIDKLVAAEREACAKVLDEMADQMAADMEPSTAIAWVRNRAAHIRARGKTE